MKIRHFKLSDKFVENYADKQVPWGPVGYITYKRTYSRRLEELTPGASGSEEWYQTCRRVIEGMFNMQKEHCIESGLPWNDDKAQRTAKDAYERLFTLKWTPPGRGCWMMGTKFVKERTGGGLFNCFSKDTKVFIQSDDINPVIIRTDFNNLKENLWVTLPLTYSDGKLKVKNAQCISLGEQQLYNFTFKYSLGRSNYSFNYEATENHRWILADGTETLKLKVNDKVRITPVQSSNTTFEYQEGFAHGLIFGDGYVHNKYPTRHMIRLCSDKDKECLSLLESLPWFRSTSYCNSNDGDPFVTLVLDNTNKCSQWKQLPTENAQSPEYLAGFVRGWAQADSWAKPSGTICLDTQKPEAAEWLKSWAPLAGFTIRGIFEDNSETNFGIRSNPLIRITLSDQDSIYKVDSITPTKKDTVWCFQVPGDHRFMLGNGLVTGNCAFCSTKDLASKGGYIFQWMMDALMLGIGVGFDTLGASTLVIQTPNKTSAPAFPESAVNDYQVINGKMHCIIADSREGWTESIQVLLDAFFKGTVLPIFVYDCIRPEGQLIKGFGGTSSGAGPLIELHQSLTNLYTPQIGKLLESTVIVDTENLIGRCVVSGNVRRSAALAIGQIGDIDFMTMKSPALHKEELDHHRWGSNNSIEAIPGMDYHIYAESCATNGEPGFIWLDNARHRGRFKDGLRSDDLKVAGFNPCVEQQLEDRELCCLVETYPWLHENYEDWQQTLKIAYLYAKTVTLAKTSWPETNAIMLKNRRIGLSISGFEQASNRFGSRTMFDWCDRGYEYVQKLDATYSDWLCIPRSKRTTSVKPSGTVSLLNGSTPGMHWPIAQYAIRRIVFASTDSLVTQLLAAGYRIEISNYYPNSVVVEFPIETKYFTRSESEISMWEQLERAAQLMYYWADNSVSVTVKFHKDEAKDIEHALKLYETRLKAVSFLANENTGYVQMPFEPITKADYLLRCSEIKEITRLSAQGGVGESYCDGDKCVINPGKT